MTNTWSRALDTGGAGVTPGEFSTEPVLAVTSGAVYLRLPRRLWAAGGRCDCSYCHGSIGWYDTLVVPYTKNWTDRHPFMIHLPDGLVEAFIRRNGVPSPSGWYPTTTENRA